MLLQKAADSEGYSLYIWGIAQRCYTDEAQCLVCNVLNSRNLEIITPTIIEDCFVKCGFSIGHVSSIDDSAVKLSEGEENNWHS
jgi:hypothetical protein